LLAAAAANSTKVLKYQSFLKQVEISTEKFTIYEVIGLQKTISIKKIKTFAPKGTEGFSTNIISALPVEQ
jgi:hypothetical protein